LPQALLLPQQVRVRAHSTDGLQVQVTASAHVRPLGRRGAFMAACGPYGGPSQPETLFVLRIWGSGDPRWTLTALRSTSAA
jgi:hypothetical protein